MRWTRPAFGMGPTGRFFFQNPAELSTAKYREPGNSAFSDQMIRAVAIYTSFQACISYYKPAIFSNAFAG